MADGGDLVERVRATGLADRPLVVLLSGGRDSTCLLDVAVTLLGPERVGAVHVDYGLRGAASDGDRAACAALCAALGVELTVEQASRAPEATGNLHAWARDVRYAAAARRLAEWGATGGRVAAGHTQTDQVETILYRLATSPGRRALLGMDAARGDLVRPLLAARATREETAAHCRARGLGWREDASNDDHAYARARVRDGLVPALRAVDGRAEANVLRTAALLRDEAAVLDAAVAEALRAGGGHAIARDALAALPPALGRLVLRRLAEDAVGGLCARAATRLDDVLALGADGALDLGDGARALVAGGLVRVGRTPAREPKR